MRVASDRQDSRKPWGKVWYIGPDGLGHSLTSYVPRGTRRRITCLEDDRVMPLSIRQVRRRMRTIQRTCLVRSAIGPMARKGL